MQRSELGVDTKGGHGQSAAAGPSVANCTKRFSTAKIHCNIFLHVKLSDYMLPEAEHLYYIVGRER